MGLFKKEPPEKKAYWKAFGAMMKKPNAETFAAMEAVSYTHLRGCDDARFLRILHQAVKQRRNDLTVFRIKRIDVHQQFPVFQAGQQEQTAILCHGIAVLFQTVL